MEYEKDYSLLRPFDLEAAKAGANFINQHGDVRIYVDGPDYMGQVCAKGVKGGLYIYGVSDLRMAPLAWVEGKPVYPGDSGLWHKGMGQKVTALNTADASRLVCNFEIDGRLSALIDSLTWTPPKLKREGWVNVYPSIDKRHVASLSSIYLSQENADQWALKDRIACVRVEWEEPAA